MQINGRQKKNWTIRVQKRIHTMTESLKYSNIMDTSMCTMCNAPNVCLTRMKDCSIALASEHTNNTHEARNLRRDHAKEAYQWCDTTRSLQLWNYINISGEILLSVTEFATFWHALKYYRTLFSKLLLLFVSWYIRMDGLVRASAPIWGSDIACINIFPCMENAVRTPRCVPNFNISARRLIELVVRKPFVTYNPTTGNSI